MGLSERLLSSDTIWYCSQCRSCVFVCPQDVSFADINKKQLQQLLKDLDDAGKLKREKEGSSYLLYPA